MQHSIPLMILIAAAATPCAPDDHPSACDTTPAADARAIADVVDATASLDLAFAADGLDNKAAGALWLAPSDSASPWRNDPPALTGDNPLYNGTSSPGSNPIYDGNRLTSGVRDAVSGTTFAAASAATRLATVETWHTTVAAVIAQGADGKVDVSSTSPIGRTLLDLHTTLGGAACALSVHAADADAEACAAATYMIATNDAMVALAAQTGAWRKQLEARAAALDDLSDIVGQLSTALDAADAKSDAALAVHDLLAQLDAYQAALASPETDALLAAANAAAKDAAANALELDAGLEDAAKTGKNTLVASTTLAQSDGFEAALVGSDTTPGLLSLCAALDIKFPDLSGSSKDHALMLSALHLLTGIPKDDRVIALAKSLRDALGDWLQTRVDAAPAEAAAARALEETRARLAHGHESAMASIRNIR